MILDGWGIGDATKSDVIASTATPYWDSLMANYPHSKLEACGEFVGLPDGQMGNSEVGHLNIGGGRVVYQDLVKINIACRDNTILENPEIKSAFSYAKENGKQIHFMGLVSNGGVHSSLDHLFKLIEISKVYGLDKTFVHCFMDGRDTDPKSGKGFIEQLEAELAKNTGKIGSIIGRFYAMDRDKRWERVKEAYDLIVKGIGKPATDMVKAMEESYAEDVTDEFIKPIVHVDADGKPVGTIQEGDVVIFFNYRNDRAKELTIALTQTDMPENGMNTIKDLQFYCMTPYDSSFTGVHILFNKENVTNTLGEVIEKAGLKQLHIAETEKYAHVTFFFNGGREEPFANEDRILVPSPKVATYDLKPEMSAYEVKDKLVEAIGTQKYDWIVVTEPNCMPASNQWLKTLARNFTSRTEVVLGYSNYKYDKSWTNRCIGFDNLFQSMRYLGFALLGKPYMGIGRNMAYRKELFYQQKGFSAHLNLQRGDDDLFINQIANKENTRVETAPEAIVQTSNVEMARDWYTEKIGYAGTAALLKGSQQLLLGAETASRLLFHACWVAATVMGAVQGHWLVVAVSVVFGLIKWGMQGAVINLTAKALNESRRYYLTLPIFDFLQPLQSLCWKVCSRFKKSNKLD
jgi:2,3-bisphosphoglycerate-independent phosphoglycerate mutase